MMIHSTIKYFKEYCLPNMIHLADVCAKTRKLDNELISFATHIHIRSMSDFFQFLKEKIYLSLSNIIKERNTLISFKKIL